MTSTSFNPFHDQLLLSGGSDARVNLWRVSSISSAPLLELGDDDGAAGSGGGGAGGAGAAGGRKVEPKMAADVCIRSHDDHDTSVAAVAWSTYSAWVYASLSYDGKFVIAQVPSTEKYKILL